MQTNYTDRIVLNNEKINRREKGWIKKIVLVILIFMFIYSFTINPENPSLSSSRISCIAIFIWGFFSQKKIFTISIGRSYPERAFTNYLLVNVILLLYTSFILLIWGSGSGETVTNIYLNILTFSVAFYYGSKYIFDDEEEFMQIIMIVSIIQSFVVFFSVLSPSVYSWIREYFYSNSYFELTGKLSSMRGYALGIGCITSKGSQKLSLGIVACVYFILKRKKNMKYLIAMLIITLASTAVSRTGLIYTLIAFLYLFKSATKKTQSIILKSASILLLGVLCVFIFDLQSTLITIFWRLSFLFQGGIVDFFKSYFNGTDTIIPNISIETLVGTGVWSGMSGSGLSINADGGFFRTYFSLGLICAIAYYIFFLYNFCFGFKSVKVNERRICKLSLIFILIGEFKEPLLFDWYYQTLIFLFMYLSIKNSNSFLVNPICELIKRN